MRVAGLARWYRWPAADLLAMTLPELAAWEQAAVDFNALSKP